MWLLQYINNFYNNLYCNTTIFMIFTSHQHCMFLFDVSMLGGVNKYLQHDLEHLIPVNELRWVKWEQGNYKIHYKLKTNGSACSKAKPGCGRHWNDNEWVLLLIFTHTLAQFYTVSQCACYEKGVGVHTILFCLLFCTPGSPEEILMMETQPSWPGHKHSL